LSKKATEPLIDVPVVCDVDTQTCSQSAKQTLGDFVTYFRKRRANFRKQLSNFNKQEAVVDVSDPDKKPGTKYNLASAVNISQQEVFVIFPQRTKSQICIIDPPTYLGIGFNGWSFAGPMSRVS